MYRHCRQLLIEHDGHNQAISYRAGVTKVLGMASIPGCILLALYSWPSDLCPEAVTAWVRTLCLCAETVNTMDLIPRLPSTSNPSMARPHAGSAPQKSFMGPRGFFIRFALFMTEKCSVLSYLDKMCLVRSSTSIYITHNHS